MVWRSFLETRRRSSLLAAPRVEYAPFLDTVKSALAENRNEYLALFQKYACCGTALSVQTSTVPSARMISIYKASESLSVIKPLHAPSAG